MHPPTPATGQVDDLLVEELRVLCERALDVVGSDRGLPRHELPGVECLENGVLHEVTREEISWKLAGRALQRSQTFWPHVEKLSEAFAADPAIAADTGVPPHTDQRTTQLWATVLAPIFERYGRRQPDLAWNPSLAERLVGDWRASHGADPIPHQTIAPLHNLRGPVEPVTIDADTVIRPMTDDDRDELWRHFGVGGSRSLSLSQLCDWTDVIDTRWRMSREQPISDEIVVERVGDLVTALRLHHPGVSGTTILWTRRDPDDAPAPGFALGQSLSRPLGDARFMHPLRTTIGPDDGPQLKALADSVASSRGTRRVALAIRRFNSAHERHNPEDALIDLWIAFEALLLPERSALHYRASLRIGRLVGSTSAERQKAYETAYGSYDYRSNVVHGAKVRDDLAKVTEDTRHLARLVLHKWVLHPPPGDVHDLEREMLA